MKKTAIFLMVALMMTLTSFSMLGCGAKKIQTITETKITDYTKVAKGTKYYVSTKGNDDNDGKTPETAIKTLAKASSLKLNAGDGLFLKRGDVWSGESLVFFNSGVKGNPVYISAYGEGEKPVIKQAGQDKICVTVNNSAGLIISSLELAESYGGLEINYNEELDGEAMNREYLVIEDIFARDMTGLYNSDEYQFNHTSFGIIIRSRNTSNETLMLRSLAIRNCYFYNCNVGMSWINHIGKKFEHGGDVGQIKDFLVENCKAELCGQWGMSFSNASDGIIRNCQTYYTGQNSNSFGSCAFLVTKFTNVLIDNLVIDGHYRNSAQSYDGCGFDFEAGNVNVTLQNSTIKNIDGCAIFIFDNGANVDNIDILIDNCIIENYGLNVNTTYATGILLASNSTGKISNVKFIENRNMEQIPSMREQKGSFEDFVLENNVEIQNPLQYEWSFKVPNNVQNFGTTNYYWEGYTEIAGSLVDNIKCKDGYLTAYYGTSAQYIQSPNYIACNLSEVNSLFLKLKNNSSATKMKFEYTLTSKSGTFGFEFDLPAIGSEKEISLDLNKLISDKRGYLKQFRLYLIDGVGEVSISNIGIRV